MIRATGAGVEVDVRVIPRASKTACSGVRDDAFVVRVAAPPVDLTHKKIKEEIPLAPVLIDDKGIASKVAADGSVSGEQKTFKSTDPISVMMKFHESPHGLQSSIVVIDPKGAKVYRDQRAMNGAKMVTFTIPPKKLKPGHYRVDGYWGGNVAVDLIEAEYRFRVRTEPGLAIEEYLTRFPQWRGELEARFPQNTVACAPAAGGAGRSDTRRH